MYIEPIGIYSDWYAMCNKLTSLGSAAILCTAGMSAYGLGGTLASDAFAIFMTTSEEYGLGLWPKKTFETRPLSSVQHQCLSMLLSVPYSTSRLALRHLTTILSFRAHSIKLLQDILFLEAPCLNMAALPFNVFRQSVRPLRTTTVQI